MFKNIKQTIKELAYSAVSIAEQTLESGSGKEKKEMAVDYVVSQLPIAAPFKMIVAKILSGFIDEAVEHAVDYMKKVQASKG